MSHQLLLNKNQLENFNHISRFLALRDLPLLTQEELYKKYGIKSADILILLGSSLISTIDITAEALKAGLIKKIMLVGGIGHSTHYLYHNILCHPKYHTTALTDRAEADIYNDILVTFHGINPRDILIENKSTNCGSNAKNAYALLKAHGLKADTCILIQDPTMQLRTYASFLKEWGKEDTLFINYAPYVPLLSFENSRFFITGMNENPWSIERFISLVMGEVPRLQDNESGYGPHGKNYIVHVDIPEDILSSYEKILHSLQHFLDNRGL